MSNIIPFTGVTTADIPVDDVIDAAAEAELSDVLVVGITKDGGLFLSSSTSQVAEINLLLDKAKYFMMVEYYGPRSVYEDE